MKINTSWKLVVSFFFKDFCCCASGSSACIAPWWDTTDAENQVSCAESFERSSL